MGKRIPFSFPDDEPDHLHYPPEGLLVLMATSTGQWRAASQSLGSCQLHLVMPWCGKETHPSLPPFQQWALKHMMARRTEYNVSIAGIGPWQCSDLWLPPALSVVDRFARNNEMRCLKADESATDQARHHRQQHSMSVHRDLVALAAREGDDVYGARIEMIQ